MYVSESVWLAGESRRGTEGGGGGVSWYHPIPPYQMGVVSAMSLGSTTMRNVPDVALNADPSTGYTVLINGMLRATLAHRMPN
jgi:kumamolisin